MRRRHVLTMRLEPSSNNACNIVTSLKIIYDSIHCFIRMLKEVKTATLDRYLEKNEMKTVSFNAYFTYIL